MMLDLHEGILGEFAERAVCDLDGSEFGGFRAYVRLTAQSRAPRPPKPAPPPRLRPVPQTREQRLSAQRARRALEDVESKRARYRAESKAKRARMSAEIRALRDARARER